MASFYLWSSSVPFPFLSISMSTLFAFLGFALFLYRWVNSASTRSLLNEWARRTEAEFTKGLMQKRGIAANFEYFKVFTNLNLFRIA